MIGETISHYKILRKLGAGGMGEVYLAEDTGLERKVALKFLPPHFATDPEILERFKREAKSAASLNHPNIVTVYEVGQHEDRPYIAMAYVEGETLTETIARGDVSIEKALNIVGQLCDGLGRAHEAGVVHRDIKPDNVFIEPDGRVKILDFGLASRKGVTRITQQDSTMGTLYYMSPEQSRGEEVGHRSDIFSLGVVLYELIAGQVPFAGEHAASVLYAIANTEPQPLSRYNNKVTPELERIVRKVLAKRPEDRYQSTADLAVDLKHAYDKAAPAGRRRPAFLRYGIPAVFVFVAVALVLVLKPFRVEISPDQTAVAEGNRVAIMYFENMVDPADSKRLGEIVTDLLITNLSRSEGIQVVSSQRLYDVLKLVGHEGEKVIDRSTSTEVARVAGAKWMMLGRILQVDPTFIVSSQLIDMETGNVVTSQRVTGAPGETIFEIVDRMTGDTQGDLHIPVAKGADQEISVADVTTSSLEAYQYYLEGQELGKKFYREEARESYRRAIAADSTFAMAYLRLAIESFPAQIQEALMASANAVKYANRASERERLYIEGINGWFTADEARAQASFERLLEKYPDEKDAHHFLGAHFHRKGQFEAAARHLERIVELDPMDELAYNQLAYTYRGMGEFDRAIAAINRYIELAPEEPNPYDSRADMYAFSGRIDEAIDSYKKALELRPDYAASIEKLGHMYLFQLQDDMAREQYQKLVASEVPAVRSVGRRRLATIATYRGRLDEALKQLDLAISADEMEGFEDFAHLLKFFDKSFIHTERGEYETSLTVMEAAMPILASILPKGVPGWEHFKTVGEALSFAQNQRLDEAKARIAEVAPVIDEALSQDLARDYHIARGVVELGEEDITGAIAELERAEEIATSCGGRYLLAGAYSRAGRYDEAIEMYERILTRYDDERLNVATWSVKAHYYVGVAYEESGDRDRAIAHYERFLSIWVDADPGIKEVPDAIARLNGLSRGG